MKQTALIFIALWLAIQLPLRAGQAPAEAEDAANQSKSAATAGTAAKAGDFHTPEQDKAGMTRAAPVDKTLPNVLILGDSISIGYTVAARDGLKGKANVIRPRANCGDTRMGLKGLAGWLGNTRWDVIHFNWGLWDLCYRNPESKEQGNRDKVNGKLSVPPEEYERNLEELVGRLKATGARLIWASTTVVPEGEAGRFVGDDVKYNAIAARVMQRHGIPIDDLHALSKSFAGKYSTKAGDVHYTREGSQRLAAQVVSQIEAALTK